MAQGRSTPHPDPPHGGLTPVTVATIVSATARRSAAPDSREVAVQLPTPSAPRSRSRLVRAAAVLGAAAALALPGTTGHAQPGAPYTAEEVETGWVNGRVVGLYVDLPIPPGGPFGPSDQLVDEQLYLVGPIDPAAPQDPGGVFPVPPEAGGGTITIPVHDKVLPRRIPEVAPADCFGAFVLAAADAPAGAVATRTDPNGSGLELAAAIRFGPREIALDARWAVELGLAVGWLELRSVGWGGVCWTGPVPAGTAVTRGR